MHANGGMAGARAARDNGDTWLAGELAIGFGHMDGAGFKAAGYQLQTIAHGIKAIEQIKIAFTRHAKRMGDTLGHQGISQELTARPSCFRFSHESFPNDSNSGGKASAEYPGVKSPRRERRRVIPPPDAHGP